MKRLVRNAERMPTAHRESLTETWSRLNDCHNPGDSTALRLTECNLVLWGSNVRILEMGLVVRNAAVTSDRSGSFRKYFATDRYLSNIGRSAGNVEDQICASSNPLSDWLWKVDELRPSFIANSYPQERKRCRYGFPSPATAS
jgi:hypothetical protein